MERSSFILSVKGIALYVRLKVRFIEEGASFVTFLVFVIKVSMFLL